MEIRVDFTMRMTFAFTNRHPLTYRKFSVTENTILPLVSKSLIVNIRIKKIWNFNL